MSARPSGSFPNTTEPAKTIGSEKIKAITLRSGKETVALPNAVDTGATSDTDSIRAKPVVVNSEATVDTATPAVSVPQK